MCVCLTVCMCKCEHVSLCVSLYAHVSLCMHVCVCMHICMFVYVHEYVCGAGLGLGCFLRNSGSDLSLGVWLPSTLFQDSSVLELPLSP